MKTIILLSDLFKLLVAAGYCLSNTALPAEIEAYLKKNQVPANAITLELTESSAMSTTSVSQNTIQDLHELGLAFSIDDFGTGYSALSYLKDLPIDVLKVDRAFVRDIHKDKNCAAIAEAILAMAKNLGMGVVAEGVEVTEELEFLMARGCDVFQGFLFSKPLSVEQFKAYGQNQGKPQPVLLAEVLGDEAVR